MSEYQYYAFQAIDRPLTKKEMAQLRSCSTRARITPTSFVNNYSWGSFKGEEDAWMEKYFDAFLYGTAARSAIALRTTVAVANVVPRCSRRNGFLFDRVCCRQERCDNALQPLWRPNGVSIPPAVVDQPAVAINGKAHGYPPYAPVARGIGRGQQTYWDMQSSRDCTYLVQLIRRIHAKGEHGQALGCVLGSIGREQG